MKHVKVDVTAHAAFSARDKAMIEEGRHPVAGAQHLQPGTGPQAGLPLRHVAGQLAVNRRVLLTRQVNRSSRQASGEVAGGVRETAAMSRILVVATLGGTLGSRLIATAASVLRHTGSLVAGREPISGLRRCRLAWSDDVPIGKSSCAAWFRGSIAHRRTGGAAAGDRSTSTTRPFK